MLRISPSVGQPASESKVSDIQALRGVSILFVLFYHLSITPNVLANLPNKVTVSLHVGVQIFFLLSGFVVTRSLMRDEFNGLRFFLKRIFRLLPAIFVFLGLTAILNFAMRLADLPDYAKQLFTIDRSSFVQQALGILGGYFNLLSPSENLIVAGSFSNGAMWSLAVEDQFYACLAVVVTIASLVWKGRPKAVGNTILVATAGLYFLVSFYRLAVFSDPSHAQKFPRIVAYLSSMSIDFMLLGVVLGLTNDRLKPWIRQNYKESGPFVAVLLMAIVVGLLGLCESPLSGASPVLNGIGFPVSALLIGAIVLLANNNLAFPASRGSAYRFMEFLGDRSYTYYLFHFPVFVMAWLFFHYFAPKAYAWYGTSQLICVTLILVPMCEVIYRYVELPCTRRGRDRRELPNEAVR